VIINCPYPPSVNAAYRTFRNRVILSKVGREYIDNFLSQFKNTFVSNSILPLKGRLRVRYDVYAPDNRRRDLANLDKLLSDCITKCGVWEDDSNIDDLRFIRQPIDRENPRVIATIEELTNE